MEGRLPLDDLVTARRPLEDAEDALERLATGEVLRTLLVPDGA
jgi:S-(hydroxymethyl)glutathione dehydrogenase / alcohol dehydrogenase